MELTQKHRDSFTRYRWLVLSSQCYFQICQGLLLGIVGPSMTEMAQQMNVKYEAISLAIGAKGIGMLMGSPLGGVFKDYVMNRVDLFLAASLLLEGVATVAMPFCPNLATLALAHILHGLCWGSGNVVNISYLATLWGKDTGQYLNLVLASTAVGKLLGPPVVAGFLHIRQDIQLYNETDIKPYLIGDPIYMPKVLKTLPTPKPKTIIIPLDVVNNETLQAVDITEIRLVKNGTNMTNSSITVNYESKLYLAFVICFIGLCLNALLFFIAYLVKPRTDLVLKYSNDENENEGSGDAGMGKDHSMWLKGLLCLSLFILCLLFDIGIEASGIYIFSIAITEQLGFSIPQATLLNSLFYVSLTISRIVAAMLLKIRQFTVPILMNTCLLGAVASGACMAFLGMKSQLAFGITTLTFVFFLSPSYPTAFAYANYYVPLTGLMAAVMDAGLAVGYLLSSDITAAIFDNFGAQATLFQFFFVTAGCPIASAVALYIGYRYKTRPLNKENTPLLSNNKTEQSCGNNV